MEIIPFEYESKQVRVIQNEDGNPEWVAKDVCHILDMDVTQTRRLDNDEKGLREIQTPGGPQNLVTVNEPGLYTLIIRSNKPEAKKFRKWITSEVLPAIRKSGKYEIDNISEIDLIIQSAQSLKKFELKQIEHDNRLSTLEAKSHQNSGQTGYWTIIAWSRLNNLKLSLDEATKRGREAARLSNVWGVDISKVPDERFGFVNSYREDVLEEIFCLIEGCR
jgi:prophage antirepressor-like protein